MEGVKYIEHDVHQVLHGSNLVECLGDGLSSLSSRSSKPMEASKIEDIRNTLAYFMLQFVKKDFKICQWNQIVSYGY